MDRRSLNLIAVLMSEVPLITMILCSVIGSGLSVRNPDYVFLSVPGTTQLQSRPAERLKQVACQDAGAKKLGASPRKLVTSARKHVRRIIPLLECLFRAVIFLTELLVIWLAKHSR